MTYLSILICSWEWIRWLGARWTPSGLRPASSSGYVRTGGFEWPWRISWPHKVQATRQEPGHTYTDRDLCRTDRVSEGLDRNNPDKDQNHFAASYYLSEPTGALK